MSSIVDFLFWWIVEPRDDWPHLRLILLGLVALLLLVSTGQIVEELRNPYAKQKRWQPASPGRAVITHLAIGLVLGSAAALVLPTPAIAPMRVVV